MDKLVIASAFVSPVYASLILPLSAPRDPVIVRNLSIEVGTKNLMSV